MNKQKAIIIARKAALYSICCGLGCGLYNFGADFYAARKSKPHIKAIEKTLTDSRRSLDSIHTVYEYKQDMLWESYNFANSALKTAYSKYDSLSNANKYKDRRIENIRKFEANTLRNRAESEIQRRFDMASDSLTAEYETAIANEVAKRDSTLAIHRALISKRLSR